MKGAIMGAVNQGIPQRRSRGLLRISMVCVTAFIVGMFLAPRAAHAADKPNILVIFGDDIGQTNISRYTHGLVGYSTPNIDRVGEEGMTFTDYYAENSCTAGRSSFITGQSPMRVGLTKVGVPGAPVGLQKRDITIAEALKPLGYATGQFGKNHLGDKDEYLPTNNSRDQRWGTGFCSARRPHCYVRQRWHSETIGQSTLSGAS